MVFIVFKCQLSNVDINEYFSCLYIHIALISQMWYAVKVVVRHCAFFLIYTLISVLYDVKENPIQRVLQMQKITFKKRR